jgi:hypothetical protein
MNHLTDIAARPPDNAYFPKDRDTLQKRSGCWLKELARQGHAAGFDLNALIAEWDAGGSVCSTLGRN